MNAIMLAHAVMRAVNGWAIFPLNGKNPRIRSPHPKGSAEHGRCKGECGQLGHGVNDATTDIRQVCQWWRFDYRGANIGARVPAGLFVVDFDPRKPGYGAAVEMLERHGTLPDTLMTISGRRDGGVHRFYRRPPGKLSGRLLVPGFEHLEEPGIDIKTPGGYVVAPPSIHPDTGWPYAEVDAAIADPGWLASFVVAQPRRQRSASEKFLVSAGYTARPDESIADWYTENHTWGDVLEPHSWTPIDGDGDRDGDRWLHPTATSKCSATINYGCLFVYSTSTLFDPTTPADPHGYTRFRAYAELNFNGDLSEAARSLRKVA
jgi:hypothetical protein